MLDLDLMSRIMAQDTFDYENVDIRPIMQVTIPIDNRRRSCFDVSPVVLFLVVLVVSVPTGLKLVLTRDEDVSDEGANFAGFVARQVG